MNRILKKDFTLFELIKLVIVFIIIILIMFLIFKYKIYKDAKEDNDNKIIRYTNFIYECYEKNPELFEFDQNGYSKINIEKLNSIMDNNHKFKYELTKNLDECVGFIIINKTDENKLNVDISHICDMIDY